jgi:homocysteine S-methyltransferase
MANTPFLQRLEDAQPILADGAMGTMLHAHGIEITSCFEALNITDPDTISLIHNSYIEAGAELIESNTFGANRFKLVDYGLANQVAEINRAGAKLARAAADTAERDVYVAGSVGPIGSMLQPYGRTRPEDARAAFADQIRALVEGGVDVILFETFTNLDELLQALAAVREIEAEKNIDLPVICQMTYTHDNRTVLGHTPDKVARDLHDAGADVIGVNCGSGPEHLSTILQLMRQAVPETRVSALPNAGLPHQVGGRMMYKSTADYFGDYALTFKAIGANIIGGCCGTTPEHIAAMRAALDDPSRPLPQIQIIETRREEHEHTSESPTSMARKLADGKFIVSVEIAPPRSYNVSKLLASARLLQEAGADVVNVADSPTARMRMSPWAVCHLLQSQLDLETVLHFPTRGRNLLRIQGDLLGSHALGLRNLFVCMGDPTRIGDYPEAMDNFDIAPSGLLKLVKQGLNQGVDQAGNSIGQPTTFNAGCALNMGAADIDKEIRLAHKKIDNGADFALGQVAFEPAIIERFLKRYEEIYSEPMNLPVVLAIMPLYSVKHARFLHNEVPGITVPDGVFKRLEDAGENAKYEGVRVAQEVLRDMKGIVQGAYVIPAFGHYELAADVIDSVPVGVR